MEKLFCSIAALFFFIITPISMAGTVVYLNNDTRHYYGNYTFDDLTYHDDRVKVDYDMEFPPDPGTHINITDGGQIGEFGAFNNSSVNMSGGSIRGFSRVQDNANFTMSGGGLFNLGASGNSTVTMTGGRVDYMFTANGNSTVTMSNVTVGFVLSVGGDATLTMEGGEVKFDFEAGGNANVTISGGAIGTAPDGGHLMASDNAVITISGGSPSGFGARDNATIFLDGSGFEVTAGGITTSLSYGDKLSDFVQFPNNGNSDYYRGIITGTLADGSALNESFAIANTGEYAGTADIIIIPEPCSLVLLTLGGLVIRRRKA